MDQNRLKTVKPLGIYQINIWGMNKRMVATGNKTGILYEFLDCTDLKRQSLHYPASKVKLVYDGNCSAPSIEE